MYSIPFNTRKMENSSFSMLISAARFQVFLHTNSRCLHET